MESKQPIMGRLIRYQGAVVHDHKLLLIKHSEHASGRSYWVIPGGGREKGESEEECIRREVREETHLKIQVIRQVLDQPSLEGDVYKRNKTYLCRVLDGKAQPGYEPEPEAAQKYSITEVGWFDLRDSSQWDPLVIGDPLPNPCLRTSKRCWDTLKIKV
jgi:ADP-ribose pyrophosphatase YjhB (NUDIX family)